MNYKVCLHSKFISIILILVFAIQIPISANAQTLSEKFNQADENNIETSSDWSSVTYYSEVKKYYTDMNYQSAPLGNKVTLNASNLSDKEEGLKGSFLNEENIIIWKENKEILTWEFDILNSGLYQIRITYAAGEGTTDIVREISFDGEIPFEECKNISFLRQWESSQEIQKNSFGDELSPTLVQKNNWRTMDVVDSKGLYSEPFQFYLEKGKHTFSMKMMNASLYIKSIDIIPIDEVLTYSEMQKEYKNKGYKYSVQSKRIEAEYAQYVNYSSMRMLSDSDPSVYPLSRGLAKMNSIGGEHWSRGNSTIWWKVNVPETGIYKLVLRLKNNYTEGKPSYRKIEIDNKVPYKELENYSFSYSSNWKTEQIADNNGVPYEIYLTEGEHTLSMVGLCGDFSECIRILEKDTRELSELSLNIVMITGQNPDPNYDYKIEEKIPNIVDNIKQRITNLEKCMSIIEKACNQKTGLYEQLKQMRAELKALIKDTYYIPSKLDNITSLISEYGDFVTQLEGTPLALDYIELLPVEDNVKSEKASFFSKFYTMVVDFMMSFTRDYQSAGGINIGDVEIKETIDVWIGRGKDWGELVKRLSDEKFTSKTGIDVKVHIVPAGQLNSGSANALLLAVSSGEGPDVALGVDSNSVGEFAMRNAVTDLTEFSDFKEIKLQFSEKLFTPLTYKGGVFAIPETVNFKVLIYRKDILNRLGIKVPNTWQDLYQNVLPILSQNNMQFYYPIDFEPFLYQNNAQYYNNECLESALNTSAAYKAFEEFCNLYIIHGVPIQADFFNRFRTGEMPIGVGDFTMYIKILSAAPELYGRWGISCLPGHISDDGKINHSQGRLTAESVMLLQNSTKKESAWEFIKWWVSNETQTTFGNDIESIVGSSARWNSANTNAFYSMAWTTADLAAIKEALSQFDEAPVVLGGYFTSRHINNAFNRSVVSHMNIRESLEKSVKDINKELARRRANRGE